MGDALPARLRISFMSSELDRPDRTLEEIDNRRDRRLLSRTFRPAGLR